MIAFLNIDQLEKCQYPDDQRDGCAETKQNGLAIPLHQGSEKIHSYDDYDAGNKLSLQIIQITDDQPGGQFQVFINKKLIEP
jgi:hypothetical protein